MTQKFLPLLVMISFSLISNAQLNNSAIEFDKPGNKIGLSVSYFNSTMHFEETSYLSLGNFLNETNSANFGLGAFYDLSLYRFSPKLYLHNEVWYKKYTYEKSLYNSNYSITFGYFELKNMIRYYFNEIDENPFNHYFNIGITNGFMVDHYDEYRGQANVYEVAVKSNEMGFNIGYGVQFNNLAAELRYEMGDGVSHYYEYKSHTQRLEFILTYTLFSHI